MTYRFLFLSLLVFLSQSITAQTSVNIDSLYKPRHIVFTPNSFSNSFSLNVKPVLHINSGDTIQTETVDAFGRGKNGVKRQRGGNPLTGPFYITNSKAGDALKITLTKVSLNRNYAYTTETFASRSMPDSITKQFKKTHIMKWKLDIENGFASPDSSFTPYNNLSEFKVPLNQFLGCIGVAPRNRKNEILSFFRVISAVILILAEYASLQQFIFLFCMMEAIYMLGMVMLYREMEKLQAMR